MASPDFRLPRKFINEIEKAKGTWRIEPGDKHGKLYVNDTLCAAIPRGRWDENTRFGRNVLAQIRRALRGLRDHKG